MDLTWDNSLVMMGISMMAMDVTLIAMWKKDGNALEGLLSALTLAKKFAVMGITSGPNSVMTETQGMGMVALVAVWSRRVGTVKEAIRHLLIIAMKSAETVLIFTRIPTNVMMGTTSMAMDVQAHAL